MKSHQKWRLPSKKQHENSSQSDAQVRVKSENLSTPSTTRSTPSMMRCQPLHTPPCQLQDDSYCIRTNLAHPERPVKGTAYLNAKLLCLHQRRSIWQAHVQSAAVASHHNAAQESSHIAAGNVAHHKPSCHGYSANKLTAAWHVQN
jgi:hypothetical protein